MRAVVLSCLAIATTSAVHGQAPGRAATPQAAPARQPFAAAEASIADMRRAMVEGRTTSREIVQQHLLHIALYGDRLNAVIAVNPGALREAEERDRERAQGKVRGPLHGIPIALKDNIHTLDMPTTGGVLAFDGLRPPYEATLTRLVREAGAVIIAKTVMNELAHWVSDGMPDNYNALSGHAMNPYDPRRDPREAAFDGRGALSPGGSSSGSGTAASFRAANVGTETAGSILFPADRTMLAAIKPTVGRVSRHGIIPLTADQDTAGPMARSVTDAAILLGALEGHSPDPGDPATQACTPPPRRDYTAFLRGDALRGARIGMSFAGRACSEPRLIAIAYAFEQATQRRVPPQDLP
jgi:amidase